MSHISFPSVEQFRHVIRGVSIRSSYVGQDANGEAIYDGTRPKPVLRFRASTKLHGTNAGIHRLPDGTYECQGRNRIVTVENDNAGFAWFVNNLPAGLLDHLFAPLVAQANGKSCVLFGEWAGGNIQKGVAITGLEKFFCIFAACVRGEGDGDPRVWLDMATFPQLPASPEHRVFNILEPRFGSREIEIDFNRPELVQNDLIEFTNGIEAECPVGKAFGVSGVGEGAVYTCLTPGWTEAGYWFKVKGSEHSSSKVKTLAAVDVEKVAGLYEFADKVCTKSRLEQGIQWLQQNGNEKVLTQKSTAEYLRWVYNDVIKEETDTMIASKLEPKEVGKAVGTHARKFFFAWLNEQAGLPPPVETA